MSTVQNVFVVGLDDHNRRTLAAIEGAHRYRFHGVLTYEEIYREEISFTETLARAEEVIDAAGLPVDAIIGFWDFPVSSIVPILQQRYGLNQSSLLDVVKCEHKYWSRLIQQEAIEEVPAFALIDPYRDQAPPPGLSYPMWIKPVKSFASMLAIRVDSDDEFHRALAQIRAGISRLGDPFDALLEYVELPAEIAAVGGHMCIAEEALTGQQVTIEGFRHGGRTTLYALFDSIHYPGSTSFLRYQYPSALPAGVQQRIREISHKVVEAIGLEGMTFNIEYFWDPHTDEVMLLEINPRHSQSHADLLAHVDGITNHEILLDLALGTRPVRPEGRGKADVAATWFIRRFTDGIVTRHPTPAEVAAAEAAVPEASIEITAHEGQRLSRMHAQDSYSYRLATVFIGAREEAELTTAYERVVSMLPFEFIDVAPEPVEPPELGEPASGLESVA